MDPEDIMDTTLDRATVKAIHTECDAALSAIAAKHGLELKPKGASFTEGFLSYRAELRVPGNGKEARDLKALAGLYGLEPGDVGKTFVIARKTYTLIGSNARSVKYPLLAERDGKTYKVPSGWVESIAEQMARAAGRPYVKPSGLVTALGGYHEPDSRGER